MTTEFHAHDQIARLAHEIWISQGSPHGCELEHWLEAERQLTAEHLRSKGTHVPNPQELAAKAAAQKEAARSPQLQHAKNAPKPPPPESGKPVWRTPHSS